MELNPRRLLDDDFPEGYLESDRDFVDNNTELCVNYLESLQESDDTKKIRKIRDIIKMWESSQGNRFDADIMHPIAAFEKIRKEMNK